jgi:hypothetical protein
VADFCHKCSIEHFGEDMKDLANLGGPEVALAPGEYWTALCEGCMHGAGCQVDDTGLCHTRRTLEERGLYPDPDGSKEKAWEVANAPAP